METVETKQHQLALRWVINDVTDQAIIKETLEYKPGCGWFRNRLEHMDVLGVVSYRRCSDQESSAARLCHKSQEWETLHGSASY